MNKILLILLLAIAAFPLLAQEEDDAEPSDAPVRAKVTSDVNARRSPGGPKVGVLAAGTEVTIIGTNEGWMRVRSDAGKAWVDRRFLQSEEATLTPRAFALAPMAQKVSCPTTLAKCPDAGCSDPGSSSELLNIAKHGPGKGPVKKLQLTAFQTLQAAAGKAVGEGAQLDAEDRQAIRKLKVGSSTLGEGRLVAVTGFIAGEPHANTGESVNCGLKTEANNDIHISIVPQAGDDEFDSIVVEMIPQDRPEAWSSANLHKVVKAGRRVKIEGQLFYDSVHRVNKDKKAPKGGQPKRFSLWELHPVSAFYVCDDDSCTLNSNKGWTKLEDVEFPLQ